MILDPDVCFRAVRSRDSRFDGRFFVAVVTTKIYCRPICPAPAAKRQNIRFYEYAAAAERAGFRPCMRCRPEVAPWTPAWNGTSAVVTRALRLIGEGEAVADGLTALAARLGVGARQLRRLFVEHVGAPPVAVMQARRVHFARRLIEETSMPIADVAAAAGFRSIRRFNTAMQATYRMPPRELRRRHGTTLSDNEITLRLAHREPYDWNGITAFLRARAIPGVEAVGSDEYRRTIEIDGVAGVIRVARADRQTLVLTVPAGFAKSLKPIVDRVSRLFDLAADPAAIGAHLRRDALLRPLIRRWPGIRVPGAWDPFELTVRAIVGQQVSVAGATTIIGRIAEEYGTAVTTGDPSLRLVFPGAARLASADIGGMPRRRAETVRAAARAFAERPLDADTLAGMPGIGPWTVNYVAMRAWNDPDAFPAGDLVLQRAVGADARALEARSAEWRPWRAYAAMLLWRSA